MGVGDLVRLRADVIIVRSVGARGHPNQRLGPRAHISERCRVGWALSGAILSSTAAVAHNLFQQIGP